PSWRSRPSRLLIGLTAATAAAAFAVPFLGGFAGLFGFEPLTPVQVAAILVIIGAYLLATEIAKRWFYRRRRQ
ncbi:MAG TPA: cation transporting ATPase C-terminal domain-containing protein, partial [Dongiaceae bacterium]|nr:cation transporting ATPase C-terminal domain-containing protein [Dongiaceae bacterium]